MLFSKTFGPIHLIVASLLEASKLYVGEFSIWIRLDNGEQPKTGKCVFVKKLNIRIHFLQARFVEGQTHLRSVSACANLCAELHLMK